MVLQIYRSYQRSFQPALEDACDTDGCVQYAILLIEGGADVNLDDDHGRTLLIMAAKGRNYELMKVLIHAGADVNAKDDHGCCALTYAAATSRDKSLEIFMEAADKIDPTRNYLPPLSDIEFDVGLLKISTLKMLLRTGIKVNVPNVYFNNTLIYYILECERSIHKVSKDICILLFAAGERVTVPIVEGRSRCRSHVVKAEVPEYLFHRELQMCLKHLCREAIRNHLLDLDLHTHLLSRIPRLNLPSSVTNYLLYNQTLGDDEQTTSAGAGSAHSSVREDTEGWPSQIY